MDPLNDSTPTRDRGDWAAPALSALLAVVLYAQTLAGTRVYDDRFHTEDDPRLKDVARWKDYFTQAYVPDGVDRLWRPLVSLSYAVQWQTTGDRAWPLHAVNVLLHALASALVAALAMRLTRRRAVALLAGCVFAAHPVHVEGVAYLVGRADSACALGVLGALVLMFRPLTNRRAWGIFGCFVVAVLSKEQGLLLPMMLIAVWLVRRASGATNPDERKPRTLLFLLIVFTFSGYVIYREQMFHWYWESNLLDYAIQPMTHSGVRDRALIPIALLGRAAQLLVVPVKLSPEYGLAVITARQDLADPYLWVGALTFLAAIAGAWVAWRRRAISVLFLLFCAAVTYGMVSNVKLIGVVFAERLLYLPSAFVLILAAMALARLPRRPRWTVATKVISLLGVRTVTYAARWNDRLAFYERSVAENPRAARLHVLLARELMDRGTWQEARKTLEDGLIYAPDYWKLWSLSARVAVEQGRWQDAQRDIDRASKLDPFIPDLLGVEAQIAGHKSGAATKRAAEP
jgi:hypothetical protein